MFFRRSFFLVVFGLLLVVGLFGFRQRSNYAQGFSEGYAAAQQAFSSGAGESAAEASGSEAGPTEPVRSFPYHRGWGWGFFPFFGIFGFFFQFWLILIVIGFFLKMLGFGRHHRWRRGHWRRDGEEPYEKQPEDVEPDIQHT